MLPLDVGAAVLALLSDNCDWINGERIEVSGGQNIQVQPADLVRNERPQHVSCRAGIDIDIGRQVS